MFTLQRIEERHGSLDGDQGCSSYLRIRDAISEASVRGLESWKGKEFQM